MKALTPKQGNGDYDILFGTSTTMMMMIIGSALMLYMVQQLIPAQSRQVQPESYGIWYLGPAGHIMNVENGAGDQPVYVGEAAPGTPNSAAGWRIYKYEYVVDPVSGDMISGTVRYAGGSTNFDKIWDNRAEYVYS